jgi:hypothetical protein
MAKDFRKPEPKPEPMVAQAEEKPRDLEAEFRAEVRRRYHQVEHEAVRALHRNDPIAHAQHTAVANALAGILNAWRQHG